uniref:heme ABC transporter ATP-binding protein n=1 Tax=Gynurincola endophyticus TaxID=2479004 RepID=UPI000F8EB1F0|nr:heme ABC transporter ATP-binding protein [Gynurincola endophyticus]
MLKVDSVTYAVKKRTILKDITFSVRPGEVLALLGANGAGKSTLLRMITGEQKPDSGSVSLYGKKLQDYNSVELASLKATLSQHNVVNMPFLCQEIIMMGRYPYHRNNPTNADHDIVLETMKVCGIEHLAERSFLTLSGGEQQRVQLARVLAQLWDRKRGLIILDEPVTGLDMLYQQQTMAIARALAKKGYMVLAVLHEINLAAQYADRILMMKNGRRWKDGTPSEVLTPLDIYSVFSIETEVMINPRTLKPFVLVKEIRLQAENFNSWLPEESKQQSLKDRYISLREMYPHYTIRDIARQLNISEASTVMLELNGNAVLLEADIPALLRNLPALKSVTTQTYSEHVMVERTGIYQNYSSNEQIVKFDDEDIDLNVSHQLWQTVFAYNDIYNNEKSLQFFNAEGELLYKATLTDESDIDVYDAIVRQFRSPRQEPFDIHKSKVQSYKEIPDESVNQQLFCDSWHAMKNADELSVILRKFGIRRSQAIRLAPDNCAAKMSLYNFKKVMTHCMNNEIPVKLQAGNRSCIHTQVGVIKNLIDTGSCYQVADAKCKLFVQEDAIGSVWHIIQPTITGPMHLLELYDHDGELMLQVTGKHEVGKEHVEEWKNTLERMHLIES